MQNSKTTVLRPARRGAGVGQAAADASAPEQAAAGAPDCNPKSAAGARSRRQVAVLDSHPGHGRLWRIRPAAPKQSHPTQVPPGERWPHVLAAAPGGDIAPAGSRPACCPGAEGMVRAGSAPPDRVAVLVGRVRPGSFDCSGLVWWRSTGGINPHLQGPCAVPRMMTDQPGDIVPYYSDLTWGLHRRRHDGTCRHLRTPVRVAPWTMRRFTTSPGTNATSGPPSTSIALVRRAALHPQAPPDAAPGASAPGAHLAHDDPARRRTASLLRSAAPGRAH